MTLRARQKVLFAFNLYYYKNPELNCPYFFFVDTVRRLGYETLILDFGTVNEIGTNVAVSQLLLSHLKIYKPDIFFVLPALHEIPTIVFKYITKYTNTLTIAWNTDDDRRWNDYSEKIAHVFDVMLTTYESAYKSAREHGHTNVFLTQWAANPKYHRPIEDMPKKYDASFIGVAYDDRPEYIRTLIDAGFSIKFGGKNWNRYFENIQKNFSQEEIAIITNQSKISLVFSKGCCSDLKQIKGRVFESPAYRVCTFIEDTPGLEQFFVPGQEIVVFHNKHDLIEKMYYYLSHDAEREAIAEAGYQRVQKDHLYEYRLRPILEQLPKKKKEGIFAPMVGLLLSFYFSTIVNLGQLKRACLKKHV